MNGRTEVLRTRASLENLRYIRENVKKFLEATSLGDEARMEVLYSVEEAVTNSIIHGYGKKGGDVVVRLFDGGDSVTVEVDDEGTGFVYEAGSAKKKLEDPEALVAASGRGLLFMETFMDELMVDTNPGEGTRLRMVKLVR